MLRLTRVVIPDMAHYVTQRSNARMLVFFGDEDRREYLRLIATAVCAAGTRCLAWCLMDSHMHLILVPADADGLRATLGQALRRYTRMINLRESWRGHLFQERFAGCAMDDAHLAAAVRYVENNSVAAHLVAHAQDWHLSSTRSHIARRRAANDPLTDVSVLAAIAPNWRAAWRHGLEADDAGEAVAAIEWRLRTGRPLGTETWIAAAEGVVGRSLRRGKP